jgi:hypothetical protein
MSSRLPYILRAVTLAFSSIAHFEVCVLSAMPKPTLPVSDSVGDAKANSLASEGTDYFTAALGCQ